MQMILKRLCASGRAVTLLINLVNQPTAARHEREEKRNMKAAQFNKTTKADRVIMALIVDRAMKLENYDRMTCMMDLSACHCNGCELDFKRLFEFPVFDFAHDICGIARHINRETGILRTAFYRDAPANIYYRRIDWLPWHVCSDERLNYALENQERTILICTYIIGTLALAFAVQTWSLTNRAF